MDEIKRIPKNYDGKRPTGRLIGSLLPRVLKGIQKEVESEVQVVFDTWYEVVGKRLAPMTEAQAFTNGVVFVKVKNATLHSIFSANQKKRLIDEMHKKLPGVRINALVFRI
ncbi:MAG: DUF721 domain-containing protein [Simkaniaceae bacterium]|nr:DUF721 domain-containing protein [Simkaniaceae bacterium]